MLTEQINAILTNIEDNAERARKADLEQRRLFGRGDVILNAAESGPQWLSEARIAQEVVDSLHFLDGKVFDLDTFCIMSNHSHVIFTPLLEKDKSGYCTLSSIRHSHKRHTALKGNGILKREGQFWQHESYDHYVRDEYELQRIRRYIVQNPVSAGLVEQWDDWPWTYCKWL